MTIEQLVLAIRSLPVPTRLRVIELATHDVATDVALQIPEAAHTMRRSPEPATEARARPVSPFEASGSVDQKLSVLHLSVLQIGNNHRFNEDSGSMLDRLPWDLEALAGDRPIDLAIVTGDLAQWALPSEMARVYDFSVGLSRVLGFPRRRVVLLPGNQDINRGIAEDYIRDCEGDEKHLEEPYFPKYGPLVDMHQRFYEGETDITFTSNEPWSLFVYEELRVAVAVVNSTIADGHRPTNHYGHAGEHQLRWFAERMRDFHREGWKCIGAIHHDPVDHEPVGHGPRDERACAIDGLGAPVCAAPAPRSLRTRSRSPDSLIWGACHCR